MIKNWWMASTVLIMAAASVTAFAAGNWRMGVVYACFAVANATLSTIG